MAMSKNMKIIIGVGSALVIGLVGYFVLTSKKNNQDAGATATGASPSDSKANTSSPQSEQKEMRPISNATTTVKTKR